MKTKTLILIALMSSSSFAETNYVDLSAQLAKLRTEVEQLNEDVQEVRRNYSNQLRSYSLQKAELEATVRKEEIKHKQLLEKISRIQGQMKNSDQEHQELRPMVFQYIDKLTQYVDTTIPYKRTERLENLEKLKTELDNNEVRSHQALSRLWSAYEDEFRLTRENQISKEKISVEGEEYLAEVAKLGSTSLFFRLDDGRYGRAIRSDKSWTFSFFQQDNQIRAAKNLFGGLKKQIKSAEYIIPNGFQL
ncbi:MAG: DUF3450 family protein [Bdellovibrionales bacterium]|nr:DUF3450 family protein [Bdellovibrionales bacterium]